ASSPRIAVHPTIAADERSAAARHVPFRQAIATRYPVGVVDARVAARFHSRWRFVLTPGQVISGRYRLVRLLGEGGMGAVWAARNEAIERDVAIKVMLPQLRDASLLQRFFNEAKICGRIRHPGIVDVLDLGQAEDGSPYIVMELLDGEPFDNV